MPFEARPLDILPGIFKEASDYASQGRFVDGNNVRFWKGFPERIGGNVQLTTQRTLRPARGIIAWRSLNGTQIVAMGHARGVELLQGGTIYNVTPEGDGGFATLSIAVGTITSGPYTAGETVTTAAGGSGEVVSAAAASPVLITADNGTHEIAFTSGSGTFLSGETITATGGGTARVLVTTSTSPISVYDYTGTWTGTVTGSVSGATGTISSATALWTSTLTGGSSGATSTISSVTDAGRVDGGATFGWGEGAWGQGVWGGAESLFSTVLDPTTWTFDLWGEDLIACPRGGKIYVLDTSAAVAATFVGTPMTLISQAPSDALGVFMNDENRTLVAYGAHDGSASDPLNIRWCDEEDYTVWTAAADNTAGSLRCEDGSTIVGKIEARNGHLISTDTAIYLFRYIGPPFYFSLQKISDQSTLIGPHAGIEMDGVSYWMGQDGFYVYDGVVNPLPCDVHQYVFSRLNVVQAHKVFCGTVRAYNEVWWFYAADDSADINAYVAYNTVERTWHIGNKARTSWLDSSVVVAYPTGTETDGTVNAEELGTTDNGASISYTLETSEIEVNDGRTFLHARKLIPDYNRISGTHNVTITTRGYPQRTQRTNGPFSVTSATEDIAVRSRGAMMQFHFAGSDDFRLGRWRYLVTGKGRKDG